MAFESHCPTSAGRCLCLGIMFVVAVAVAPLRADPPKPLSPDQVQFDQKTVEAQMQELQERMFRLGDLTRDSEPDDSARLLMGLRKAREEMILEQMHVVLDDLGQNNLAKASDEQAQVLVKLESLKQLLTSTDLDMQMRLEQLRTLNAAIAKLDSALKEEKRQRDQTGKFADQLQKKTIDPAALLASQQDQRQNRQVTDSIAATVKDLGPGPAKATDMLGNASQSMSLAEGHLGAGRPSDAQGLQSAAVDSMQQARDQLEQERQRILDELQGQVRKQVIRNLQDMLDRQKTVREATETIVGRLPSGEAATLQRVVMLAAPENAITRICDDTTELVSETEFSVALPPALAELHDSTGAVADHLQTGIATAALVSNEKDVEHDLQDLLDTFKELSADPGPPSHCRGCKGNKNKLLAELKVLRMLQVRVNAQTAQEDARRAADGPSSQPSDDLSASITATRDRQADIQTATNEIHQELFGS